MSLIQWVFFLSLGMLGFGLKFGPWWLIVGGLLLAGLLPPLLVANLFIGRR